MLAFNFVQHCCFCRRLSPLICTRLIDASPFQHPSKQQTCTTSSKAFVKQTKGNTSSKTFAEQSDGLFVKPLRSLYSQLPCRFCKGDGYVVCGKCNGKGKLGKGGFHKKNPVALHRIVGSKWTALETTFGWRHFIVHTKRRGTGKEWFLEMVATCDKNTHFWIHAKNLKDRDRWSMGWLQRDELMQTSKGTENVICKACKGAGRLRCRACDSQSIDIVEV
eukprot:TRINITY_DN23691_c0_g1_i1.p1 TRINITY_DN23691_c0_g1~~TRINITY_DN23691_c0_g1_i1.p1  ORF type:complete len:220 (-),score=26.35 TRINITY_DN23691_c0_g1_i1:227-886(-)